MPESNLDSKKPATSNEKLAQQTGLDSKVQKPLLMQMLELQLSGGRSGAPIASKQEDSPEPAPGVQFSDEKASRQILPIGEGLAERKETDKSTNKNIDKANSLLDELSREEKSGFKAQFDVDNSDDKVGGKSQKSKGKKQKSEFEDNYDEDFDEIDEDLPEED